LLPSPELAPANGNDRRDAARLEDEFLRTSWTEPGPGGADDVVGDGDGLDPSDAVDVGVTDIVGVPVEENEIDGVPVDEKDIDGVTEIVGDGDTIGDTDAAAASWPSVRSAPHTSWLCSVTDRVHPDASILAPTRAPSTAPH
jgi:hypothetical protein